MFSIEYFSFTILAIFESVEIGALKRCGLESVRFEIGVLKPRGLESVKSAFTLGFEGC